jgi:hypothetical protein
MEYEDPWVDVADPAQIINYDTKKPLDPTLNTYTY